MKKVAFLFFTLSLLCHSSYAQYSSSRSDSDCAVLSFAYDTVNFGTLEHGNIAHYELKYTNTGKCPLIISPILGIIAHVFKLSKNLLQPGDSGKISIYYYPEKDGPFASSVTLNTNTGPRQLTIKGIAKPADICADMRFKSDTLDLGPVHYVYGKSFAIKVPSTGKCPLQFSVNPVNDYMNMEDYTETPVSVGDSGVIDIHIGGNVIGHYYGMLNISSPNSHTNHQTLFIKASFMPPDQGDSSDTEIEVDTDMVDKGNMQISSPRMQLTAEYTVKNIGNKALMLTQSGGPFAMIKIPDAPLLPGKSYTIPVSFVLLGANGPFIKHAALKGNFRGKEMPIYIKGNAVR